LAGAARQEAGDFVLKLKPEEKALIEEATNDGEQRTDIDFAVVLTRVSDRYALYPLPWATLGALLITTVVAILRPGLGIRAAVAIQVPLIAILALAFSWLPIRLMTVPQHAKRAHARQLAHREFAAHRMAWGAERSGILIFVSLGERYMEILADPKTHARLPAEGWNKIVGDFTSDIEKASVADCVMRAVRACSTALTEKTAG
jgi:putative membrane protein